MFRLFPLDQTSFSPPEVYTFPELHFPTGGEPLAGSRLRPYIYFNMVSSVDGKTTTEAQNAVGLGSKLDHYLMKRLRLGADAVLVGEKTFRQDPFTPDFPPEFQNERSQYFPANPYPLGITLSRDGNLPLSRKFFEAGPTRRVVFLHSSAPPFIEEKFQGFARTFRLESDETGHSDLGQMLAIIYEKLGVGRLLCEGGPSLIYALLSKGFGDELFWTLAPKIVGGHENLTLVEGPIRGFPPKEFINLDLISLYQEQNELFFRYKINRGRAEVFP